jgi:hypothetical protein
MASYTIALKTTNWYCECCGSGTHFSIKLFEEGQRVWSTSRDDQFGGVLNDIYRDEDLELYSWQDFIKGMKKALEIAGHNVYLEELIDDTDPQDRHAYLDDEDYRDDLL